MHPFLNKSSVYLLSYLFRSSHACYESKMELNFVLVAAITTLAGLTCSQSTNGGTCLTQTIPNPILQQFPNNVPGIINSTIALIPIPYSQARSIIPSHYNIL